MLIDKRKADLAIARYNEAFKISAEYHVNDLYGDKPYFEHHLKGVADLVRLAGYGLTYQTVALMHDLHEDHKYPIDLIISKFGYDIGKAVEAISYKKGEETKAEYWQRCSENHIAAVVKQYDAKFNKESSYSEFNDKRAKYYAKIEKFMKDSIIEKFGD